MTKRELNNKIAVLDDKIYKKQKEQLEIEFSLEVAEEKVQKLKTRKK